MIAETTYIRPNITIETITHTNPNQPQKTAYVYNYQGVHYRVFSTQKDLEHFLQDMPAPILAEFEDDMELDDFLLNQFFQ